MDKRKTGFIDFSELNVGHGSFQEALLSQYELKELHISLEGENGIPVNVDYATLPIELKRRIDYTSISIIEIQIGTRENRGSILRQIFGNLNKGGTLLSDQEQRNGIYNCLFYEMLRSLNRTSIRWREVWGRESADEEDMEMLLRLCAMKRYVSVKKRLADYEFIIDGYNSNYAKLLDRFSDEVMGYDNKAIMEYQKSLIDFLELFQVKSSKKALLESFYVVYEKMNIRKPVTNEIYKKVLGSNRYSSHTRQGTVKMKSMDERWKCVYEIWSGTEE